jgi:hypothetical protein
MIHQILRQFSGIFGRMVTQYRQIVNNTARTTNKASLRSRKNNGKQSGISSRDQSLVEGGVKQALVLSSTVTGEQYWSLLDGLYHRFNQDIARHGR